MNIQTINGVVSGANTVCGTVKDFVVWTGHKVQLGFSNYLIPAIKNAWTSAIATLNTAINFLKTGPGLALVASASLFAFGLAALRIASEKDFDELEDQINHTAWRAIGATSIAAATITAGIGIAFIAL